MIVGDIKPVGPESVPVVEEVGVVRGSDVHHDDVTAGGAEHDVARDVVDVAAVHEEMSVKRVTDGRSEPGVAHTCSDVPPDSSSLRENSK